MPLPSNLIQAELHMAKHERDGSLQRARERKEQEAEYEASLKADQEAEAAREEAEMEAARLASLKEAEEKEAKEAAEKKAKEDAEAEREAAKRRAARKRAREELPDEPPIGTPGTTRLRVRLPDGTVLTRTFLLSATVAEVYAWLNGAPELEPLDDAWSLQLPSIIASILEGPLLPTDETLEEIGLRDVNLFVQDES